ncbi:MAG: hypothetical protein KBD94_05940, partial [Pyrinomonadaceae bacterium]|nr:hypothetical protein [Pyrinomonadaceae bacterium]
MYYAHQVMRKYLSIPAFLRGSIIEPVVNRLPVSTKNLSFDYKAKRFVRGANLEPVERHHAWFGSFAAADHDQLLTRDVLDHSNGDIYADARDLLSRVKASDKIEQMQQLDISYYLAEDILTKVDRAAMAVSLETRAPFLDPRIGQFAASIPVDYKLRGGKGKFILKKAVEPLLPAEILNRPKKGFGIPIAKWLKGRLNPLLHDLLDEKRIRDQDLFDAKYVTDLVTEHETGRASHHKQLWTLLVFQLWHDNFLRID